MNYSAPKIRDIKGKGFFCWLCPKNNYGNSEIGQSMSGGIFGRAVLMPSIPQNKYWLCDPTRQLFGRHEKSRERCRDSAED